MIASSGALVKRAIEETGLSDFGMDGWQVGLEHLVEAARVDIGDNAKAVASLEAMLVQRLVNRLRVEQWYRDHAAEAAQAVEGPVAVLGLPRTGTTALHYLLGVDPQFRYQRTWEVFDPVPPPDAATESQDPRRLAMPERNDVRHISSQDGPLEDTMVYALHFHNQELGLPLPTYTRWWRTADLTGTLAYHERVLRLLHSHRPPYRWLLKAPMFIFHARELAAQYPNVRFVMTHRDPMIAMPSACSTILNAMNQLLPAQPVDPVRLGREVVEHFAEGIQRVIADRRTLGEKRFCDVGQGELETDPLGIVERIYDFLGLDLSGEVRAAMDRFSRDNRRGARGAHRYTAEEFGLTADGIRKTFADYIDHFGERAETG